MFPRAPAWGLPLLAIRFASSCLAWFSPSQLERNMMKLSPEPVKIYWTFSEIVDRRDPPKISLSWTQNSSLFFPSCPSRTRGCPTGRNTDGRRTSDGGSCGLAPTTISINFRAVRCKTAQSCVCELHRLKSDVFLGRIHKQQSCSLAENRKETSGSRADDCTLPFPCK